MSSHWLHLSRYTQIPQKANDDETLEEKEEPSLTVHLQSKKLLSFVCLIGLSLVISLTSFALGVKVARFQSGRPIFSDTIKQGLPPHEHRFEYINEMSKYLLVGLARLSVTTIALHAPLQSQVIRSRYGTL